MYLLHICLKHGRFLGVCRTISSFSSSLMTCAIASLLEVEISYTALRAAADTSCFAFGHAPSKFSGIDEAELACTDPGKGLSMREVLKKGSHSDKQREAQTL